MKTLCIFLNFTIVLLFFAGAGMVSAQTTNATAIQYAYDANGNRISKVLIFSSVSGNKSSANGAESFVEDKPVLDLLGDREVKIYPNPTNGILKVEFVGKFEAESCHIQLYSISGIEVFSTIMKENPIIIDITNQPDGSYLMLIRENDELSSWTIIKN